MLQDLGLDVSTARNGQEALDQFKKSKLYTFDYIFMDPPYNHELEKSVLTYLAESSLLAEEGIIIVEASKETDFDYAEDLGYNIIKEKEYKTNKHVFLEPAGRKEIC